MKRLLISISVLVLVVAAAYVNVLAQSAPAFTVLQGTAAVTTRPCNDPSNVGSIYTTITNPSVTSVCQQTGAASLGQGAYGWVSALFSTAANTFTGVQTFSVAPVLTTSTLTAGSSLITFPGSAITVSGAVAQDCGTAAGACAATNTSATVKIVRGTATSTSASPSTVAITGMSPAFTSAATYTCVAEDATTPANVFAVLTAGYVSGSAVTFTGPNTLTDVIRYQCIGN